MTTLKPNVIAMIVVSTDLITEAKPLTAHAQATYSVAFADNAATLRTPSGMNMPRHSPKGATTTNAVTTRNASGADSIPSVTTGSTTRYPRVSATKATGRRRLISATDTNRLLRSAPTPLKRRIDARV